MPHSSTTHAPNQRIRRLVSRGIIDLAIIEKAAIELGLSQKPRKITRRLRRPCPVRAARTARAGFVYVIRAAEGLCKIGYAKDLAGRLRAIRCSSSEECTLVHSIKTCDCEALERLLHSRYAAKRGRGEWFSLDDADIAWLQSLPDEI